MRRVHYSYDPLGQISERPIAQGPRGKPVGLWYSIEGLDVPSWGWVDYCHIADYRWPGGFRHASRLVLDETRILRLTESDLEKFTTDFRFDATCGDRLIDWDRVSRLWAGVEICPWTKADSFWDLRFRVWWHGWDCASGCVWDASAVLKVEPIEPPEAGHGS